jgi:hypothetical protein
MSGAQTTVWNFQKMIAGELPQPPIAKTLVFDLRKSKMDVLNS